jgi:hypothetical protein
MRSWLNGGSPLPNRDQPDSSADEKSEEALAAEEVIAVAERNGFPWPLEFSRFIQGWVRWVDGDAQTGIATMLDAAKHPSMANRRSYMLGVIAGAQIEGGQLNAALTS